MNVVDFEPYNQYAFMLTDNTLLAGFDTFGEARAWADEIMQYDAKIVYITVTEVEA